MSICARHLLEDNPDLAVAKMIVHCRRCRRAADHWQAHVLRPELMVHLSVACHGLKFEYDFVELFALEPLRVTLDMSAGLCAMDSRGVVHASWLRSDIQSREGQYVVSTLCWTTGLVVSDRGLTCLECFKKRRQLR
jgi:hypothetical protein